MRGERHARPTSPSADLSLLTNHFHLPLISKREYFANIAVYSQRRENFSSSEAIAGRESRQKLAALSSNCLLATTTMVGHCLKAAEDRFLPFVAMPGSASRKIKCETKSVVGILAANRQGI